MSILTPTQRYAAGGLLALALHQAQIDQTRRSGSSPSTDQQTSEEQVSGASSTDPVAEDPQLWVHESSGLLRPIFRFLEIDSKAWHGLEETGGASQAKGHIGDFLRLLSEESGDNTSERMDQELSLVKSVDATAMSMSMETTTLSSESVKEKHHEYEHECREKLSVNNKPEAMDSPSETFQNENILFSEREAIQRSGIFFYDEPIEEVTLVNYQRKVTVLYELLSACLAHTPEAGKKCPQVKKGYDARHRVALRLLATWLDVKWMKMEAMEVMVASSAMALAKKEEQEEEQKEGDSKSSESSWSSWKRGGIIGAAALTGGTLLAVTGGLAAPAISAGFSALAPTLGPLVPVIGASGFAAAASATGSVAGSIAVAASFGAAGAGLSGSKMAKRIGDIEEFEFKAIGENHNQGRLAVGILISGLVFEEEDYVKPWEGQNCNLERYILQWESKNLIAVSTAIQDWLTSKITTELMKQGAMMTVLSTLVAAFAWPAALLTASDIIDSKWAIAVDRSDKAGQLLAEALIKGLQGDRPVTLIGFSLGARVIFKCLQTLAETEDADGIVERVVLLGAPVSINDENWENARKMVAGRFVNAYSTNDWTLGVAFRASLLSEGLAGIQPVEAPGVENVDLTEYIEGHSAYIWMAQRILERLELDSYSPVFKISPTNPQKEKYPES